MQPTPSTRVRRNEGGNDSQRPTDKAIFLRRFYAYQNTNTKLPTDRPAPGCIQADIFSLSMVLRPLISFLLALSLALASPLGWAGSRALLNGESKAGCAIVESCPCCEGTVCPCAGEAPTRAPEAPIAPRPASDLRVDIAPVPVRFIVLIALPIAESFAKPVARQSAAHDGVRPQASLCIWRT